ncbi:hypothetical protein [Riemerella anatipestifer]|nr:hypothetical protein [Riemerella anatipestifer]
MKKQNISNTQLPANLTRSNYHIPQWVLLVLSMRPLQNSYNLGYIQFS